MTRVLSSKVIGKVSVDVAINAMSVVWVQTETFVFGLLKIT
jgi:hypothetical protein